MEAGKQRMASGQRIGGGNMVVPETFMYYQELPKPRKKCKKH